MKKKILEKLGELLKEAKLLKHFAENYETATPIHGYKGSQVKFSAFRTQCLQFIASTIGDSSLYYKGFYNQVTNYDKYHLELAIEFLNRIKEDVEQGWLIDLKGLISTEIFSDFLEMAEHLLQKGYKDAAAVMIGSTLEGRLKRIAEKNNIPLAVRKGDKDIPQKASTLNVELAKANVYSSQISKSITAWLDLRNKAAHGLYDEYDKNQVSMMLMGIRHFVGSTA